MKTPQQGDKPTDKLKIFIAGRESRCDECGEDLGHHAWITLQADKGAICLVCADLDHLVFLPSGDAAVTRRACRESRLSAVVLKWSRARRRYERQGVLVDNEALGLAEQQCEADTEVRKIRREHAAVRRAELDKDYIALFAARVREVYSYCPRGREKVIAEHACRKYSGRVGRMASAKDLDEKAVRLAVVAHIRHAETEYDELLLGGVDRWEARQRVEDRVSEVLEAWEGR